MVNYGQFISRIHDMSRRIDISGRVFGRLTVLGRSPKDTRKWHCRCECGRSKDIERGSLLGGDSKSCGCLFRELLQRRNTTHGMTHTVEYRVWEGIRKRCFQPSCKAYKYYGGRGITISAEWESFSTFLSDMGQRPSADHSIDRINNDGLYSADNCRWATRQEQGNNKRNNRLLSLCGRTQTFKQWTTELGLTPHALYIRLRNWPLERALTEPPRRH